MQIRRCRRTVLLAGAGLALLPTALIALYALVNPPATPLMVLRSVQGEGWRQHWRPLAAISPQLREAVIAAEDNLFCRHHGFDRQALRSQIDALIEGERPRGASTITMQTAKNIVLWPGRDPLRKVLEAWLTPQIELFWSKRRILEVYLNVIEIGPGVYGAEAAAQHYFGIPADRLGRRESALIAAVLPNPRQRRVDQPSPALLARARAIERRMAQLGALLDCARDRSGATAALAVGRSSQDWLQ